MVKEPLQAGTVNRYEVITVLCVQMASFRGMRLCCAQRGAAERLAQSMWQRPTLQHIEMQSQQQGC